jgi:hypothetical protein
MCFVMQSGIATAATFTGGLPASGATVSSPVTLTVQAFASYGVHTPPGWYNSLDPHLAQNATLVVDGGAPITVTGAFEWGWVYDDPDAILYDNGYMGWVEGRATYTVPVTVSSGPHTAVLTVKETPSNATFTYTWTFSATGLPAVTNCTKCHGGYPNAHESATMSNCSLCHKPSDTPVFDHGGARGTASLAACSGSASLCHGGAANHTASILGAHVHYDLDGEPVQKPATPCSTCHTKSADHAVMAGSFFSYKDLQDSTEKYEGGYDCVTCHGGTAEPKSPHGGYDTASNKCKVCHAVHRAQGAYFLLRADSQDDACDYCHVGGSAHASKVVYTANPAGKSTTNGHTIGAQAWIPDSTTGMTTTDVTLSTVASDGVTPVTATVSVRSYEATKNAMYRLEPYAHGFAGHPLESGTVAWAKVGPLALRCMNCHQVHNATAQIWRPQAYAVASGETTTVGGVSVLAYGYNLLKKYPSASANTIGLLGLTTAQLVKVPETTLNSDNSPVASAVAKNYSNHKSAEATYTEAGTVSSQPIWTVNEFGDTAYESVVNEKNLSIWCGDCHNLNIGGATNVPVELGLRSHAERTHPAPFAHGGQCYSCHQSDLATADGLNVRGGPNLGASCSRCHYSASSYVTDVVTSDFPHSGTPDNIKLLGNYSYNTPPTDGSSYVATTSAVAGGITENNLDAVCLRCHPSTGVHN